MRCLKCGRKIKDDCLFCPYCGSKVIKEIFCPKCGEKNDLDASFCKKCGTPLTELVQQEEPKKTEIPVESKPRPKCTTSTLNPFSIICMSFSLLSIVLLFSFLFVPFLNDKFLPNNSFTIIHYITNALNSTDGARPLLIANTVILVSIFSFTALFGLSLIAIVASKFVKAIKERKFVDFSKLVTYLFVMFLTVFVLFVNFIISSDAYNADSVNGLIILVIAITVVSLLLNRFYNLVYVIRTSMVQTILQLCFLSITVTLLLITTLFIGGSKFGLIISSKDFDCSRVVGPFGFVEQLLNYSNSITRHAEATITKTCAYLGTSFLLELLSLILCLLVFANCFASKKPSNSNRIISMSLVLILFIVAIIFDSLAVSTICEINSIAIYGVTIKCSKIFGNSIAKIIISFFTLASFVAINVLKKKEVID